MPTSTAQLKANKSADRRHREAADKLAQARVDDTTIGDPTDKRQWGVLLGWILSESKHLSPADRRQMFEHLMGCARQMNQGSRKVSQYTHG